MQKINCSAGTGEERSYRCLLGMNVSGLVMDV